MKQLIKKIVIWKMSSKVSTEFFIEVFRKPMAGSTMTHEQLLSKEEEIASAEEEEESGETETKKRACGYGSPQQNKRRG